MFSVACHCGKDIAVRPSAAGTNLQCPYCGETIAIPSLSILKASAERGEAAAGTPAKAGTPKQAGRSLKAEPESSSQEQHQQMPERAFWHFWGNVGTSGRVSSSAMENYTALVIQNVESFTQQLDAETSCELLVSCALVPENHRLVQIETIPRDASRSWAESLETAIRQIPAPPVIEGPVAILIYRRLHCDAKADLEIEPFSRYQERIGRDGFDAALMEACGLEADHLKPPSRLRRWWRRLVGRIKAQFSKPTPTPQQILEQHVAWVEHVESKFADTSVAELKRKLADDPSELTYRIALASQHNANKDHEAALDQYKIAIHQVTSCSVFYERRGRTYLMASQFQPALADFDKAIELAPFEPWYYFLRSQVFSGLEAWTRAITDLDTSLELAPREPAFWLRRAELHLQVDDQQQAFRDLERLLELDPNSGAGHAMLGWIYQQQEIHDLNLAVEHLNKALELMPGDLSALFSRSLAFAAQNKFELAMEDCDAILRVQPESGMAHGVRGRMLQMQGEFEEAIRACSRAIELGAEAPMVFIARGIAYSATDEPELALADCEAALEMDPQNPLALHLRGTLSIQRGELETAMEDFSKAKQIAPDWSEPREQIALLHRINENPEAAIEEQNTLIAKQPKNPAHYVNRAFAHTQAGDFEAAENDYQRACELDPENEHIHYLRGCFFIDRQEEERALNDLNRVLELAPDHDHARFRRAAILLRLKRQDDALQDFEKLIERHPDQPQAYSGRAFANQLKGDESAAEADLDRLAELAPESVEESTIHALRAKATRLQREDRYEEAMETAEEIIAEAPENPTGYQIRAWLRWYSEQHVEAAEDYTRLLELQPDEPSVRCSRGQVYAEMGEWDSALEDLNAAVEESRKLGLHQLLAFALNGRAFALAGIDRLDESKRDYEESIQLCPENGWAYYNRGILMFQRGQHAEAKQLLQRAVRCDAPELTKRKRERAQAVLQRLEADTD